MRINCNISAVIANNKLLKGQNGLDKSLERLSTGLKINSAEDNAAGMAIANKLHAQIKGLEQANKNTKDGISVVQTAESALNEVESMLQRMRELSVQSANGTNSDEDRANIQMEIDQLSQEIDRISSSTEFNTMTLLDGNLSRRCYSDVEGVSVNELSSSVPAGEYMLKITGAKPATAKVDLTQLDGANGTVKLNGASMEVKNTDTADDIKANFIDMCNKANLTYDEDTGMISTNDVGMSQEIKYEFSDGLEGSTAISGESQGRDAGVSFGMDAAGNRVGYSTSATVTVDGNVATIVDFGGFKMVVDFGNNKSSGLETTIEVTDMGTMTVQLGANEGQVLEVDIPRVDTHVLGIENISVATEEMAESAISKLDAAISRVSAVRSELGAYQNRMESAVSHLETYDINITSSLSVIEDADMAEEMVEYTQYNVITQAATSMLSQANERPQSVLQLLQ